MGKKKSNDYTVCFKLLEQAKKEEYKIVTQTNEFTHLSALMVKLDEIND